MQSISDIKSRIASIKETSQITKAMELISVSKMRKATEKYLSSMVYYDRVTETLKSILAHSGDIQHKYLIKRKVEYHVFVVIAGDSGLAGDYNNRVLNFAVQCIEACQDDFSIYTIGQMANEFFMRKGISPDAEFLYCAQDPSIDDARRITEELIYLFDANKADQIHLIYTEGEGNKNKPTITRLLPLTRRQFLGSKALTKYRDAIDFEPSPKKVFDILIPQYILGITYSALIQSVKCEHTERMVNMNNATKNAKELIEGLELDYHRARQEIITTEIAEISTAVRNGD